MHLHVWAFVGLESLEDSSASSYCTGDAHKFLPTKDYSSELPLQLQCLRMTHLQQKPPRLVRQNARIPYGYHSKEALFTPDPHPLSH